MMCTLKSLRRVFVRGAVVASLLLLVASPSAQAQTTYTWAATGTSNSIGDGGNWLSGSPPTTGTAPNFQNLGTNSDSAIFSASSNTAIQLIDGTLGMNFNKITFDASAPAYTFTSFPGNTVNDVDTYGTGNGFFNNSSHTQDFSAAQPDIYPTGTLAATNGDPTTNLSFALYGIYFGGGKMTGNFDVTTQVINASSATGSFTKSTGTGTLFITGDSGTNQGALTIGGATNVQGPFGAVRISNSNALGAGGSTTGNYTNIRGAGNVNGRLELTNNITVGEGILISGRQNLIGTFGYDNSLNPAILNVSGNNTLNGPFLMQGGGGTYNFASSSGLLTVQSNIDWNNSGDRYLTFQGAGNGIFTGNLANSSSSAGGLAVEQLGPGTLTLAGATNTNMVNWLISGGTLAVGAGASFSFNAIADDSKLAPEVFVQNNATFDVSAVSGGFTLTQTLQGTGNVVGTLHMASGTQVVPGGGPAVDPVNTWSITGVTSGVGQVHFHNGLDMSAGSQMVWHLGALSTSNAGTDFSQLAVDGPLTLGGSSSLAIDLSLLAAGQQPGGGNAFWNTSHTWTIISNTNNPGSSNFVSISGGTVATGTFTTSVSAGTLLGDVNGDHVVNGLDIAVVASHWLATGATLGQGDANGDGTVNGLDIALIASHWLSTSGGSGGGIILTYTPSAGGGTAVPEPTTYVLAALGVLGAVMFRRFSPTQSKS